MTVSVLGFSNRMGTPAGDGVTSALATQTGRRFRGVCSSMQGWVNCVHLGWLSVCTCAITSNSLSGGIRTVSTRDTVMGETGEVELAGETLSGCDPGKQSAVSHVKCALVCFQEINAKDRFGSESICNNNGTLKGEVCEVNGDNSIAIECEWCSIDTD